MKLSLIIPTFNRQSILCDTLKMAVAQDYADYEIIVVDQTDHISDELRSYLETLGERVQYTSLDPPNLPAARNLGVHKATGEIIVFIDDDVIIERDYLSRHAQHYHDPKTGGVVGLTWPVDAPDEQAALAWQSRVCELKEKLHGRCVTPVNEINGGNTSFRRQAILNAGLFDESLNGTSRGEDTDLSIRVRKRGYQLFVDTRIVLIHLCVPAGGCRNKNGDLVQTHYEHVELSTYVRLKNCGTYGVGGICRAIWRSYRAIALNRTTIRGGFSKVSKGHLRWLAILTSVSKRLRRYHSRERHATS